MLQTDLSSFSYKKGSLLPWCKRCGNENFYRRGKNKQGLQQYQCRKCKFRFVWTSDLPRRNFFSSIISSAVEIYTSPRMAASLRGIAKILKKAFDIKVSHEAVRRWVLDSKLSIDDNCIPTKTWHIDETYFKIKGIGHWLWVVRCRESGHVISWHISKSHLLKDTIAVLQKAKKQTQGVRPHKIITDGLWQYPVAIKKVIGWRWNIQKKKHIISSGIGKNAFIEQLNREIKRRVKWFTSFQSIRGALAFFGLWFYHHNLAKSPYLT